MPTYRSISISLISQFDILAIPEFLIPDARTSQTSNASVGAPGSDPTTFVDHDNSVVSVYVPTYPGSQFWISYSVAPPYSPKGLFYFKLFLNGSHVVSWGVSEEEKYEGKIMFGLFSPTYDPPSCEDLEKRAFCFGKQKPGGDAARDVLEIRVFRSSGRKRREKVVRDVQAVMDEIDKKQGNEGLSEGRQGISLANAGIVEADQPQQFYQYALIDPVDEPFATFRYYPRSVEQLLEIGVLSLGPVHKVPPSVETTQSISSADEPLQERKTETSVRGSLESVTALWARVDRALQTNPDAHALTSPTLDSTDLSLSRRHTSAYDRQRWTPSPHKHEDMSETGLSPAPNEHRANARPTASSLRGLVSSALRRRSADISRH